MTNLFGQVWTEGDIAHRQRRNWKNVVVGTSTELTALDITPTSRYAFASNVNDSVGANNLTAFGTPTYSTTNGVYGQYIILNGSSQYAQAATNTVFDITTNDFSCWGWFYRTSDSGNEEHIISKYTSWGVGYKVYIDAGDNFDVTLGNGVTTATAFISGDTTTARWYFFAASIDRDTNSVLGLFDSVTGNYQIQTATGIISLSASSLTNTNTWTLGRASSGSSNFFTGRLDHINWLTGTAITTTQIKQIMNDLHSGMLVFPTTTGGSFTAGLLAARNVENTGWANV